MSDQTNELVGIVVFTLVGGVVLAFVLSLGLVALYRRRVERLMGRVERKAVPDRTAEEAPSGLKLREPDASARGPSEAVLHWLRVARTRAALAYTGGVLAFAATSTWLTLSASNIEALPLRTTSLFWVRAWPLVLIINLIAATTRFAKLLTIGVYLSGLLVLTGLVGWLMGLGAVWGPITIWASLSVLPSLLVWGFLARRIRAVGPLVLALTGCVVLGACGAFYIIARNVRETAQLAEWLRVGATGTLLLALLASAVAGLALGTVALFGLRACYERKLLSDQSVTTDSLMLVFSVGAAFEVLIPMGPRGLLLGVLPFVAYRVVATLALTRVFTGRPAPRHLLYLRVFEPSRTGPDLWSIVDRSFRYLGGIRLISGPDLATTLVEPHDFLDYVSGNLAQRFIADARSLDAALARLDDHVDPDGRYRINDFSCREHVWQAAFKRLASSSDVVLMDLRGLDERRTGALFELREIATLPLQHVVLVCDEKTDRPLVTRTLASAGASGSRGPRLLDWSGQRHDAQRLLTAMAEAVTADDRGPRAVGSEDLDRAAPTSI